MRIEKGYHGWGADFGTEYTLFDAGLARFANMKKGGFVGRDAVAQQAEREPEWNWVGLEITGTGPEPMASDPILKNGECVGYITSPSHGYRIGKMLALGYVKAGTLAMGDRCTLRILGEERVAIRHNPHVYDLENARMKR